MGTWAPGLYSSDLAKDLKPLVTVACRLPLSNDELLDLFRAQYPQAANDPEDADHTVFWLVLADQLHGNGVDLASVRERALLIIESGADIAAQARLGLAGAALRKREQALAKLREKLRAPVRPKARKTMKAPQGFVMTEGEVLAVPVDEKGQCLNPYLPAGHPFARVGWRGVAVATATRAFGYLAVYVPLVAHEIVLGDEPPDLETLLAQAEWTLELPGTCSGAHFKKLGFVSVGRVELDVPTSPENLASYAVADVCISNRLMPNRRAPRAPLPVRK